MKEFCMGKTEKCTSILKQNQGQNNAWTSVQPTRNEGVESSLEVKANGLKDLQKRKYGTSHLLGVHGVRIELGSRTGTVLELLDMEPSNDDMEPSNDDT